MNRYITGSNRKMPENRMYERREFYGNRQQDVADYLGIRENKKEKNEGRK